jgi:hypothetical protein
VDGDLGGRQGEDQPAAAGVDRAGLEHPAQRVAGGVGVLAVHDRVHPVDHGDTSGSGLGRFGNGNPSSA